MTSSKSACLTRCICFDYNIYNIYNISAALQPSLLQLQQEVSDLKGESEESQNAEVRAAPATDMFRLPYLDR